VRAEVTEHQLVERECGCGQRTRAAAPPGAEAPVCYGPRIAAVIVYLYIGQFLSKQRTAQALAELFGIPVSSGTVAGITARAAGRLGRFLEHAREQIAGSPVAGFDETGFRVEGRLHWVHCARTGKYTLLMVHPRRGKQAIEAMGVLPSFSGVAVHDAWAPYDSYTAAGHQLCCAHARRELQAVTDLSPAGQWCWAAQAADALTAMQKLVSEAISQGRDMADQAAMDAQVHAYRSAALIGASQTAARSSALMKKHHALARRLIDRQDDYLRFTRDFRVSPDNKGRARHPHGQADRPTGRPAPTRACRADPGEVSTFRTHETRTGPGALYTPGTAVFAGRRPVRGRRLPPLSGRSLAPRYNDPARDVPVTRHQQGFPDSRPVPVLPLTCDRHGWSSGPWAFP
jgi:transposase